MINNNLIQWVQLKTRSIKHILPILLIASLSIAVYAITLKNGFVYDDNSTIVTNPLIKTLENLPRVIQPLYFAMSEEYTYRPVATFSYMLDYALFGLKPWGFHLTNILLHAANGVLLYLFIWLLQESNGWAGRSSPINLDQPFIISLLFVTHPVLSEAVNAVSYREDLLAFFFYMASLNLYLLLRAKGTIVHTLSIFQLFLYTLSCLLYLVGLLSKEMALSLPLIIFCYEWIYGDKRRIYYRLYAGYIIVTLFYIYLRFFYFYNPIAGFSPWSLIERILTLPWLLVSYLRLILSPTSLVADYDISPVASIASLQFIIPFVMLISLIAIVFRVRKTAKEISFGMFFFLITLMPVYNIVPLFNPFAERYLYLPTVGLVIILGFIISRISLTLLPTNRKTSIFILLIIIAVNSIAAVKRSGVWKDEHSLWVDTVRKLPDNARGHHYIGNAYLNQGRLYEALNEYLIVAALKPGYAPIHKSLGSAYSLLGQFDKAKDEFMTALALRPDYTEAHNDLGKLYEITGRLNESLSEYNAALKLNPYDASIHYNLGNVFYRQNKFDDEERAYLTAIKLNPDHAGAHNNLGILYEKQGRLDKAISEYRITSRMDPGNVIAHRNLALVFYKQGEVDEAIKEFITVLKLNPEDANVHYSLGNAYKMKGLIEEAKKEYEITLSINPGHSKAMEAIEPLK